MMEMIVDLKDYDADAAVHKRTASRGLIRQGDNYLLIYSKHGDYKFPGGGRKENETLEQNLIREVQEETGYRVVADSIRPYGSVIERRKGLQKQEMLEMDSHYFFCEVEKKAGERNLDDYEEEYDYQVVFMTLKEVVERNKRVVNLDPCPWVIRETKVMERLLAEK